MTGSSYVPVVVPVIAFVAMAFWLGLIFYADAHPGYRHRKPQPVDDIAGPDAAGSVAAGAGREAVAGLGGPARAA